MCDLCHRNNNHFSVIEELLIHREQFHSGTSHKRWWEAQRTQYSTILTQRAEQVSKAFGAVLNNPADKRTEDIVKSVRLGNGKTMPDEKALFQEYLRGGANPSTNLPELRIGWQPIPKTSKFFAPYTWSVFMLDSLCCASAGIK